MTGTLFLPVWFSAFSLFFIVIAFRALDYDRQRCKLSHNRSVPRRRRVYDSRAWTGLPG